MAAISFPAAFDCGGSGGERLRAAKTRLALALAVSVLLHAWLAGSKAVEAPKRPVPPAVSTLTARLEPAAASAGAEAQTQPESTPDASSEPQALRANRQPPSERVVRGTRPGRHSAPPETTLGPATRVPVLRPHAVEPTYYPARELDIYPAPLARLRFEHPERAARERVGGWLLIMLLIDETGAVNEVSVLTGEPAGYFEDAVRAVFAAARFSPARKDGRVVRSRVLVNVEFDSRAAAGTLR